MARPPKPTEQHRLDGTYRADRHGSAGASVDAAGVPTKPRGLKGEGEKLWKRVVPGLVSSGVARACDTDCLVSLCEWWARYVRFALMLDSADLDTDPKDLSRYTRLASQCWGEFARLAGKFGLTPADRVKLRVEAAGKKAGVMSRDRSAGKKVG